MPNYMLFLHEDQRQFDGRSHDEMMRIIKEYGAWAAKMREEKRFVGGEKLTDDAGKVLRNKQGKIVVTDGPYAESKEVVGGYFAITAKDYAEACEVAKECPHLKYGGRVEVRAIHEL
ncbi:MAG: transcription initiation protein [Alphaproteobacteria bacterium]|nr:transcription initiation protein [Alphaproteobacteria bacterium]